MALLSLKGLPGVQLLDDGDLLWLGVAESNAEDRLRLEQALRCIPGTTCYDVIEDSQLRPAGRILPSGFLPTGDVDRWQALSDWIDVRFPPTVLAAELPAPTTIRIVRGSSRYANNSQTPELLKCHFFQWLRWAENASEARLNRLSFACDDRGNVLVRGKFLPPLKGTRFIEYKHVAVPIGFSWAPQISVAVLNQVLKTDHESITVLFEEEESWRVDLNQFVVASRSAVRLTAAELRSQP